jgi:23S rRNA (pseudouridine1915-N3)-methyltransferase
LPNIHLLCVGKLKEKYLTLAQNEYAKRLSAFCRLEIVEKKESPLPASPADALIDKACIEESSALLASAHGTLIALSPEGERLTSEGFAALVRQYESDLSFAIGGSYGLSPALKAKAARIISFSDLTMPHQLFRIVLLEQIYRAFMINAGRTYHK